MELEGNFVETVATTVVVVAGGVEEAEEGGQLQ